MRLRPKVRLSRFYGPGARGIGSQVERSLSRVGTCFYVKLIILLKREKKKCYARKFITHSVEKSRAASSCVEKRFISVESQMGPNLTP